MKDNYQRVHGTSLLVMVKSRPLLTRNVYKTRQLIPFNIPNTILTQEYLSNKQKVKN